MSVEMKNLDVLLNHDFKLSAKTTGTALAVVKVNGTEELREIDLRQVSLWGKVKLWWNNSLNKETVTNFVSRNFKQWTNDIGSDGSKKVLFETQSALLARKMNIAFVHCPRWQLTVNLEYSDPILDKTQNQEVSLTYDRITTLEDIKETMQKRRLTIAGSQSTPTFAAIFDAYSFADGYDEKPIKSSFISDAEMGGDRVCKMTFSSLNKARLVEVMNKHAAIQTREAYRHAQNDAAGALLLGAVIGATAAGVRCHYRRR